MELTYWIAEHKFKGFTLRFSTRGEFDQHVKENELEDYVRNYYEPPRQITVAGNILEIIEACLSQGHSQPLPWERR